MTGSRSHFPRKHSPSKLIARTSSMARTSKVQRYGGNNHDQPTISPPSTVCRIRGPRSGEWISMEARPWRIAKNRFAESPVLARSCPESKWAFFPHPAIRDRYSGAKSLKNECSATSASMSFCTVCLPDSANLLGDVNGYGTPRNTAAASHTARSLKLVDPCREFVSHPLPVPRERGRARRSSVDVGMVCRETGIPAAPTFRMVLCQIRNLFDVAAEACGTNHRAIRARQTARGNIIPTRMFHIPVKQFLDARGIHRSPHLMNRAINHAPRGVAIVFGC